MKITFPLLSLLSPPQRLSLPFLQQRPSLRLPLLLLSLLLPVTESTMFTIVTGVAFDGDNLTSVEKKKVFLGDLIWSKEQIAKSSLLPDVNASCYLFNLGLGSCNVTLHIVRKLAEEVIGVTTGSLFS